MKQALIIGSPGPAAAAAMHELWSAGYRSSIRTDEAGEASSLLHGLQPDLILVLPEQSFRCSSAELRRIRKQAQAPVVVATSDVERALHCLGPSASLETPLGIGDLARDRAETGVPKADLAQVA